MGRRSRFLWIALSWMGFDMIIHVVLGFGLNEVYIMSAHWMFIIPIAIAMLLRRGQPRLQQPLRIVIMLLTVYLLVYNGSLLVDYLLK